MRGFTDANVPDQSGKTFIVTGANTGIGFEIANALAARRARVLLACRDEAKAEAAIGQIRRKTPGADLAFLPLDLADLASVRNAVKLAEKEPRIDVLINNAGVQGSELKRTKQGFEQTFGVNHLGCFAFTCLLLPKLAETPESRVVVTSSGLHRDATIDWDDLNAEKSFQWLSRYSNSKLANLLFVFELDRRLRGAGVPVTAVACHPGLAGTELGRSSAMGKMVMPLVGLLLNTPAMGAWGALHAATGEVKPGGYYGSKGLRELRGPSYECFPAERARDPQSAKRLWDVSVQMTGIDPELPSNSDHQG
ncbi:SDR family NAD(P)-dependent oxidoreductase [Klebsiella quasipneumoniae subsp. quasipneumoniae]|uniref:oxidoreductase n=1 Tax=Klebsiella quasipneumoniae TaxID=1463165 RepID=UPI001E32CD7D|nr:oxidoreductase [Klebsiella quasipneumoniae]MCD7095354.1 SDR family NAD(P)-dependent oxidoreductase [Klebsiella quasipneumoniae subsp. similipneumoniae]